LIDGLAAPNSGICIIHMGTKHRIFGGAGMRARSLYSGVLVKHAPPLVGCTPAISGAAQESCLHLPNFLSVNPYMSSTPRPYTFDSGLINPVHPVLTIPELLDPVFSFLDDPSNGTNACVCKAWSNVTLSMLWFDVDLWRLVSLLVPLKKRGDLSWVRLSLFVLHCHVDLRYRNW
jgi:hypothetical protein